MVINVGTLVIISTQNTRQLNLLSFNDGEAHLIETCNLIVIKKLRQKNVRESFENNFKNDVQQNEWILVREYDEVEVKEDTGPT